jgi:hypothetical protein
MKEVVRATCPGCRRSLTIPADWTGQTVRCKHCRHVMEVRRKVPLAAPVAVPVGAPGPTWEPLPDNADLPEYTPPVAPAAPGQRVNNYVSAFDTRDKYTGRGRYSGPRRGWVKYVAVGFLFAALAGGSAAVAYLLPGLFSSGRNNPTGPGEPEGPGGGGGGGGVGGGPSTAASGIFPRRMLAISVQNYLFANPLYNGESGTDAVLDRFRERWRVPKEQYYHLTDARLAGESAAPKKEPGKKDPAATVAPPKRPTPAVPLKNVIEGTISQFLDSSRAQDRIVLVFCGHAIEKKGEAYLVPLEGDLDEVESLIPLKWVYDKLGACKAQEKFIIFDVCRIHPERGVQRPHFGPMTEALEKAMHESPAGVSVITSCSKGEQSLETDNYEPQFNFGAGVKGHALKLEGSYFVSMIHGASYAGALAPEKKLPAPTDEIPVERFTTWMTEKLGEVVKNKFSDRTQTVKATLKPRGDAVAFDPAEPQPGRFDFPLPPPSADPKAIQSIVREIQLPPIKPPGKDGPPPLVTDVLPFSQEALKDYLAGELKTDDQRNKFQKAITDAVTEMRQLQEAGNDKELRDAFSGDTSDKAKEELKKVQEIPARVEAILQDHLEELEAMADLKDKQPKRWQVHYDYVVAQVKLRLCYANQYNLALANVRGGKVPDLNPGDTGYRLMAQTTLDKNTGANYKDMYAEAKKALAEIGKQHPNTPWALLAKSDRSVAIGLRLTSATVAR